MKKFLVAFAVVATVVAADAAAVPDLVTKEAGFWFDASTLAEEAGASLDTWNDVRGEGYPSLSTYTATKPQVIRIADGELAGKKAVTFFTVGTECDMRFPSTQEIKTAFFVVEPFVATAKSSPPLIVPSTVRVWLSARTVTHPSTVTPLPMVISL